VWEKINQKVERTRSARKTGASEIRETASLGMNSAERGQKASLLGEDEVGATGGKVGEKQTFAAHERPSSAPDEVGFKGQTMGGNFHRHTKWREKINESQVE